MAVSDHDLRETVLRSFSTERLVFELNRRGFYVTLNKFTVDEIKHYLGTNTGHGHVWKRPDGFLARCGGPKICPVCAADAQRLESKDG